jgi:hypothetical protein
MNRKGSQNILKKRQVVVIVATLTISEGLCQKLQHEAGSENSKATHLCMLSLHVVFAGLHSNQHARPCPQCKLVCNNAKVQAA